MAKWTTHLLVGATIGGITAVLPDAVLVTFYDRNNWLKEDHKLVKTHRFLHHPVKSTLLIVVLAWISHLVIDQFSQHRTKEIKGD